MSSEIITLAPGCCGAADGLLGCGIAQNWALSGVLARRSQYGGARCLQKKSDHNCVRIKIPEDIPHWIRARVGKVKAGVWIPPQPLWELPCWGELGQQLPLQGLLTMEGPCGQSSFPVLTTGDHQGHIPQSVPVCTHWSLTPPDQSPQGSGRGAQCWWALCSTPMPPPTGGHQLSSPGSILEGWERERAWSISWVPACSGDLLWCCWGLGSHLRVRKQ